MAKISSLTALTAPASNDEFPIVDKSDTSQAASGTTKKIAFQDVAVMRVCLASNATANSTTTPVAVTNLTTALGTGTWHFKYLIAYQSSATGTGVKFGVNFTGTQTRWLWNLYYVDVSATAATAAADQDAILATASVVGAFAHRTVKSTTNTGTTISVDTANSDMFAIIEGLGIVTVSGNIELYHGSETATSTQVMAGSSLLLTKLA